MTSASSLIRCLIVDDEKPARVELHRLLASHPGVEITAEAATVAEALAHTVSSHPNVAFLDVQLRGESGFDYLERLPGPAPHIVFVTAHDTHAVRGFECNALDYLLKPVHPHRLEETLRRLRDRLTPGHSQETTFVKTAHALRSLRWHDIERIVSDGNYTAVNLNNGETLTVLRPLKRWLELAPPGTLVQIHRAILVRPAAIAEIRFLEGQKREVLLHSGTTVAIGREFAPAVRDLLR